MIGSLWALGWVGYLALLILLGVGAAAVAVLICVGGVLYDLAKEYLNHV